MSRKIWNSFEQYAQALAELLLRRKLSGFWLKAWTLCVIGNCAEGSAILLGLAWQAFDEGYFKWSLAGQHYKWFATLATFVVVFVGSALAAWRERDAESFTMAQLIFGLATVFNIGEQLPQKHDFAGILGFMGAAYLVCSGFYEFQKTQQTKTPSNAVAALGVKDVQNSA